VENIIICIIACLESTYVKKIYMCAFLLLEHLLGILPHVSTTRFDSEHRSMWKASDLSQMAHCYKHWM